MCLRGNVSEVLVDGCFGQCWEVVMRPIGRVSLRLR